VGRSTRCIDRLSSLRELIPNVLAGVEPSVLASQPLAVDKMRTGQMYDDPAASTSASSTR
jgi:hypothetical protein